MHVRTPKNMRLNSPIGCLNKSRHLLDTISERNLPYLQEVLFSEKKRLYRKLFGKQWQVSKNSIGIDMSGDHQSEEGVRAERIARSFDRIL